jgi:hypothetical protein
MFYVCLRYLHIVQVTVHDVHARSWMAQVIKAVTGGGGLQPRNDDNSCVLYTNYRHRVCVRFFV